MISGGVACAVEHVTFSYPGSQNGPLFSDISLSFERGGTVVLMGPSGCGKTTFAKMMGRILRPSKGAVSWSAEFLPPHEVMYTDQQALNSVYPWQTVAENLDWPLRKRGWTKRDIAERSEHLLRAFRLDHVRNSLPKNISGGELQRLAVARCLSWQPKALILDEALSSLDRSTKELVTRALREEVVTNSLFLTLITHNLTEALSIADRCLIFGDEKKRLIADYRVSLPHPRLESSPEYAATQDSLLDILKRGLI